MSTTASYSRQQGRGEHPGRSYGLVFGILVFLAGVGLLVSVYLMARTLFDQPPAPLPPVAPASTAATAANATAATSPATQAVVRDLTQFLRQLLLMFLMCVAGSLVAGQGVNMFFKALAAWHPHPALLPPASDTPVQSAGSLSEP